MPQTFLAFMRAPDTKAYIVFVTGTVVALTGHGDVLAAWSIVAGIFLGHDVGDSMAQKSASTAAP